MLVDGRAARQAPRGEPRGSACRSASWRQEPEPEAAARRASPSPTRTSTCWWSTSRPAWSCTRARGTAPARWCRRSASAWRAGRTRSAPASCTGWTATRPGCSCWRAPTARHADAAAGDGRARGRARVPRAGRGPPGGARGHDRRAAGPRPPRARADLAPTPTSRARRSPTSRPSATSPTATLLRVRLQTGRTHQIRAHLLAIGHPVLGDPEYGRRGRYGLRRQFLHAARLAFAHPVTGEPMDLRSPLPADLAAALEQAAAERGGAVPKDRPAGQEDEPDPPEVGEGRAGSARLQRRASQGTCLNCSANPFPNPGRPAPSRPSSGPCPATAPGPAHLDPRAAPPQHNQGRHRGSGRHPRAAGGRRALRPPDAPLEPEDAPLHLRRARRHLHHRSAEDRGAAAAGPDVRERDRPPRRHRAVRRHQEAGPRRHQGDRRGGRPAVRQPPLAGRAADQLPDDLAAHPAPARPRALPGRRPAAAAADARAPGRARPTSRSCRPTWAASRTCSARPTRCSWSTSRPR